MQRTLTGAEVRSAMQRYRVKSGFCLAGHGDAVVGEEVPLRAHEARPHVALGWLELIPEPEPDPPAEPAGDSDETDTEESTSSTDAADLSAGSPAPENRDPQTMSRRGGGRR